MARKRTREYFKTAFDIVEESIHLIRRVPFIVTMCSLVGTLPFVAGLVYFWSDMATSNSANLRVFSESLMLALLFVWMKTWQVLFTRQLWHYIKFPEEKAGPVISSWKGTATIAVRQTILQSVGLLALPVSAMLTLPFGVVYAFYQNVTVLDKPDSDTSTLLQNAWKSATPWPRQNHLIIWAMSPILVVFLSAFYFVAVPFFKAITPEWNWWIMTAFLFIYFMLISPLAPFAVTVTLNIMTLLLMLPFLAKTLLGIESLFLDNMMLASNTTFFVLVCGLTFCCMDPFLKAAYVLRCFYLSSITTGDDLRLSLKQFINKASAFLLMAATLLALFTASSAMAAEKEENLALPSPVVEKKEQPVVAPVEPSISQDNLSNALDKELANDEYAWRYPQKLNTQDNVFIQFLKNCVAYVGKLIRKVGKWIKEWMEWMDHSNKETSSGGSWSKIFSPENLMYLLILLLIILSFYLIYLQLKKKTPSIEAVDAVPVAVTPDLEDESLLPDAFPEERWLLMAQEMMQQGNLRLAIRALFLATLVSLAHNNLIAITRFKSNLDYRNELKRRLHINGELVELFSQSVRIYEMVWYGLHETTEDQLQQVRLNQERLRANG